ncbi:MAG: HlyC/CorC family transporter [Rhodospirillaceae bacterium]|jgi:magnesium and cobalt transporter|nr:HlyC/CorC family transporter [Rhodospirillaceae bacterium]MBT5241745.1 HlyC/CorC family transporter [Rhodospirillaceae bacterium]MBT5566520.1 HlyC/CorC family transporter [Rhodospirillaceae bacterium]MBT6089654.1 HlyC/CorC family transporter [Rhodospirillaceae bacterium]MBT7449984.1 HlyC/CorC family transporter [Rhodospirillaceae bacterium]
MTETSRTDLDRNGDDSSTTLMSRLRAWLSPGSADTGSVRDVIEELIEDQPDTDDAIDAHERILLSNVLKQRDVTVEKIMVPRTDIVSVELETPVVDVVALLVEEGHSRVPVFRGSLDEVVGMVHIKDLASALIEKSAPDDAGTNLSKPMRPVIFVAPTARVLDLLLEMRLKRTHMAMVVDEHGGIDGLVTIEDLVEQIVGEIADEHDEDEDPELSDRADGSVMADARVTLSDFVARYGAVFSDDDMSEPDTLGGLVFRLTGRVPSLGELVMHPNGLEFEIVDADPRRIRRLRLRNLPKPNDAI